MSQGLASILWVALVLPLLLLCQRWIHSHLQGLAYLLTGKRSWAVLVYALTLLPGVVLHEFSHWLAAKLLGVRTGSFSILPKSKSDGSIQLGYVEYYRTKSLGPVRESIIGSAPLISGTAAVLLIALHIFDVPAVLESLAARDTGRLLQALNGLLATPDLFVWLYLLFAISNAMMPSAADRRAWPTFALIMSVITIALILLDLQDELLAHLTGPGTVFLTYLGLALTSAVAVDLVFMTLIKIGEWLISRIKGVELVYGERPASPPFLS
ncbi:MAG: metalloprotease family protein [Candidatus Promineifilaceae bacterium]|nr:metalloprotease family protein [Candidatus Promineifilaceae bacterium]